MIKVRGKIYRMVFRQLCVYTTVIAVLTVSAVVWSLFTDPGRPGNSEKVRNSTDWGSAALNDDHGQAGTWSPIGAANACGLGASSCFKCHNGKRAALQSMDKKTAPWHTDHEKVNYTCPGCHHGNMRLLKKELAHAKLVVDPRTTPDRCMTSSCHGSRKEDQIEALLKPYAIGGAG